MDVEGEHKQLYNQYYRPQAGLYGLGVKPLNSKKLSSDRVNGISIAANRFWLQYWSLMLYPHFSADLSPKCAGSYHSVAKHKKFLEDHWEWKGHYDYSNFSKDMRQDRSAYKSGTFNMLDCQPPLKERQMSPVCSLPQAVRGTYQTSGKMF